MSCPNLTMNFIKESVTSKKTRQIHDFLHK